MRSKKNGSYDDFGYSRLNSQLCKSNNDSRLTEYGEIMEINEECVPILPTTHTYHTDDMITNNVDDEDDSGLHRGGKLHIFVISVTR